MADAQHTQTHPKYTFLIGFAAVDNKQGEYHA